MGVPKQKWTRDEEAALKAGVDKHGAGKWRTILKDPEFSGVLFLRSNVDLKDKWRNMGVMANGCGSRVHKRVQSVPKQDENPMALAIVVNSDEVAIDACPLAVSYVSPPNSLPKRSITRLENHIIEAITNLKEPGGSNKTNIAAFIEEQYLPPPDFKRLLSAKLNFLTATGKLVKLQMKQKYTIAPPSPSSSDRRVMSVPEAKQRATSETDEDDIRMTSQAEIDLELEKIRRMSPKAAAEAAARAVKEAEAAIAAAEQAVREADAADAEAAEAEAYLEEIINEAAKKNKKNSSS